MGRILIHIALAALLFSCSDLWIAQPESDRNIEDFDTAWQIAGDYYPFFEFKGIDWDSVYAAFRPRAAARGDELYPLLHEMFRILKDGHIQIRTEGGYSVVTYISPRDRDRKGFDPAVVQTYFDEPLRLAGNGRMAYGWLGDSTGYIYFSTFTKGDWIRDFDGILAEFENSRGLILDVRNNSGGSSLSYDHVLRRFISGPIEETVYFRNGSSQSWRVSPSGEFRYEGGIVILINGASFSAAEIFAELMRQLPNVVVVGDTSGGGGGAPEWFDLPSGKGLKIPVKYFKRLDGEMIEWNGVVPDFVVEQSEADAEAGKDRQLEFAVELLRNSPPAVGASPATMGSHGLHRPEPSS